MRPESGLIGLLLLLGAAHAQAAPCRISKQTTVPLTREQGRALVSMAINETPGQFEIDTGASTTVLSAAYAQASHVGIDRRAGQYTTVGAGNQESLPAFNVHARHIQVGAISFQDWEFAAMDGDIPGPQGVSGLLGRDFLHYFDIELDFAAQQMTIWRLFDCKEVRPSWKGDYDSIPMKKLHDYAMTMPIWIDNAFLDVEFDTGAGGLLITHEAARQAGATDAALAADEESRARGLGGEFTASRHQFGMLLIGSEIFKSPKIRVDPTRTSTSGVQAYEGSDGLLGLGYLHADRIWVSFTTGALFVQGLPKEGKE